MTPYRLLDLFSGIGGFSLGLERSGAFRTVAFCEIEKAPCRVLRKHWPKVPIYEDVTTLTADRLAADGIGVDAICGGFPCQDISVAGAGAGIAQGTRSGLWIEYARLIRELRPQYVIVENVAALLSRGLDTVLGDLAALGYDAEWHCIPASAVGAPHRRDRIWIVAYPDASQRRSISGARHGLAQPADGLRQWQEGPSRPGASGQTLANADGFDGREGRAWGSTPGCEGQPKPVRPVQDVGNADHAGCQQQRRPLAISPQQFAIERGSWWATEPDVGRMAHGVPARVDRLHGLGNAVVPQIPEMIGRAILAAESGGA